MPHPFTLPGVCYFGNGALENLAEELKYFDPKKIFLVSDKGVAAAGLLETVKKQTAVVGAEVVEFLDTEAEPSVENVELCLKKFNEHNCDFIIGLGGGSPLDVAKAVSVLVTNGGEILDYVGVEMVSNQGVPKALIPTTAGTGSEVTRNAIVTDKKEQLKKGVVSRHLLPEIAIVDPALTMSLPPAITAATGMDALTHAIESYTAPKASLHTDIYALKAVELISANLRRAVNYGGDPEAREKMALGSVFAGISLANAGVGAVHAIAYPLGGKFGMAHGVTNALLLPYVMEYNMASDLEKFAAIAKAMGEITEGKSLREQARLACKAVFELSMDIGIPGKLSEFGVKKEDIPALAAASMNVVRLMSNNPKVFCLEEVEELMFKAL